MRTVADNLTLLLRSFGADKGAGLRDRLEGFRIVLADVDPRDFDMAVSAILRNQAGLNPSFLPRPPELAEVIAHQRELRLGKPQPKYDRLPDPPYKSPESRERVLAFARQYVAGAAPAPQRLITHQKKEPDDK